MQTLVIDLPEVEDVDVSLVDRTNVSHAWVDLKRLTAVDSSHSDSVTGLDFVDEIIVCEQQDCVRGLASRHVI